LTSVKQISPHASLVSFIPLRVLLHIFNFVLCGIICIHVYVLFLSGFIDVCVQAILKCSNGRIDFILEMLNPNGQ
jgi:hypothetical protein